MPLDLDLSTTQSLRLVGNALRLALCDADLNRGGGREVRQRLLEDRGAREALGVIAEELGLRFVWSSDTRLDVLPTVNSPFAYNKADLKARGFKSPHLFVACALGIVSFFYPEGDLGGEPLRQFGTLADLDNYLCDRMRQAQARPDLPRLDAELRREVSEFIAAWVETAQAAAGAGQRKSRFAELKRVLALLSECQYVRLDGEREESLQVYPRERLRVLATQLGDARHYELLMKLLSNPRCELPLSGPPAGGMAESISEATEGV